MERLWYAEATIKKQVANNRWQITGTRRVKNKIWNPNPTTKSENKLNTILHPYNPYRNTISDQTTCIIQPEFKI